MPQSPANGQPPPQLELRHITKRYPGVLANDDISLAIARGGVHALLGENGAGKSTLVKIIYGVVRPDAGEILWDGAPVAIQSPAHARRLGIGMVFQHFNLFETLTIAENIALGLDDTGPVRGLGGRIQAVSERYGLPVDPRRRIHDLSVGERQRVEIVRCLLQEPKLLIMDEPTSVLTPQEVERLFATLRRLGEEGCSILYISHKLEEIRDLCDDATVLRGGKVVATCDPRRETPKSLAEMMIGSEIPVVDRGDAGTPGAPMLELRNLTLPTAEPFGVDLRGIDLTVHAGEVVGIAGVAGNGQRELLEAVSGERRSPDPRAVAIAGTAAGRAGARRRRRLGLAFVPEDRLGRGAVPDMDLSENVLLTGYLSGAVTAQGWVRRGWLQRRAAAIRERFDVRAAGVDAAARSLSGGNLQKFILGREIGLDPRLLVLAYPTWGVDVGSATTIHRAILDLRAQATGILIVSEDLDELFELCDRVGVLAGGRLSPLRRQGETSVEELGRWMAGGFGAADDTGRGSAPADAA